MGWLSWPKRPGSREGSRRGRRWGSGKGSAPGHAEEPSTGKDSSSHSALFDLELSGRGSGGRGPSDYLARLNASVADEASTHASGDPSVRLPSGLLQRIIYLGRPVMEFELDLLQDVRALRDGCVEGDGRLDLERLVARLQDMGYDCAIKHNNPAAPGHRHNVQPNCLEKLRHEFIVCAGRSDGELSHWCLVDPRFREQFAIAQPTPQYDRVLKAAPLEFVGTPLRLQALVQTLCSEMAEAFEAQQRTLPPWRKATSMLSKWFDPEELPGQAPAAAAPPPAAAIPPLPGAAPQVQVQATAGVPPLSPFELAQAQAAAAAAAGAGRGVALSDLAAGARRSGSGGGLACPPQSRLQQQAAAALAERQSSGGGSQEFYEALAMHKESMRLQQQAAQQQQQQGGRQSPLRTPQGASPQGCSPQQQQQPQEQHEQRQHGGLGYAAAGAGSCGDPERSNKPRRRHAQQLRAGGGLPLWAPADGEEEEDPMPLGGAGGLNGLVGGGPAGAGAAALHGSGSWSDLSTILETRSNGSSPATALLAAAAATAAVLGTSAASRRSACSAAGRRASPGTRLDQLAHIRRASSAMGASPSQGGSPRSAVGFAAPPSAPPSYRGGGLAGEPSPAGSVAGLAVGPAAGAASAAAAGELDRDSALGSRGQPPHQKTKVVSLLARGLKSMGQRQAWASLLPTVSTVRRTGPNGLPQAQRSWGWRSGANSAESSRHGGDSSSRRGRRQAAQQAQQAALQAQQAQAAAAALAALQQQQQQQQRALLGRQL